MRFHHAGDGRRPDSSLACGFDQLKQRSARADKNEARPSWCKQARTSWQGQRGLQGATEMIRKTCRARARAQRKNRKIVRIYAKLKFAQTRTDCRESVRGFTQD